MNTVLALESLQKEASFLAQNSINNDRDYLCDLEIEHLVKMTSDILIKMKKHFGVSSL